MDDEQYGRAWAKQTGISPDAESPGGYLRFAWLSGRGEAASRVASTLLDAMIRDRDWVAADWNGHVAYRTDAAAYAALGRAVRAVHAAVPPLRAES